VRLLPLIATILLSAAPAFAGEIREFNVPTLERLGNELSHRDEIAAKASDLVLEQHSDFRSIKPQWWISDLRNDGDTVYFIGGAPLVPAYKVVFGKGTAPAVEGIHGQELPPKLAVRLKALQTAVKAVYPKLYDVSYNFEVLNDPGGAGFLVYALAATTKKGEVLTGGHFRITVSADGETVEQIDLLSQLIKQPKAPHGVELAAIGSSQLASNIPVETWLYSSYLYHLPMYVATKDGSTWRIVNGKIHKFTKAEIDAMESKPKKR
jgi:hypothetical protein